MSHSIRLAAMLVVATLAMATCSGAKKSGGTNARTTAGTSKGAKHR